MPASGFEEAGHAPSQQKERSIKTTARRKARGEEEIRLHCMVSTKQTLVELMTWSNVKEQDEDITLKIQQDPVDKVLIQYQAYEWLQSPPHYFRMIQHP